MYDQVVRCKSLEFAEKSSDFKYFSLAEVVYSDHLLDLTVATRGKYSSSLWPKWRNKSQPLYLNMLFDTSDYQEFRDFYYFYHEFMMDYTHVRH